MARDCDVISRIAGGVPSQTSWQGWIGDVQDFKTWDIELEFTPEALKAVALRSQQERTGARGLISILHRVLSDDMFRMPGTYTGKLQVDESYVRRRLQ